VHRQPCRERPRLTREYELARDLVDAASLDLIRHSALAARFTSPPGGIAQ
jgi:hypothetical protein